MSNCLNLLFGTQWMSRKLQPLSCKQETGSLERMQQSSSGRYGEHSICSMVHESIGNLPGISEFCFSLGIFEST